MSDKRLLAPGNIALMAMLGAIAGILMVFEFPLPFIAPSFYGIDLSEVPVLVGAFMMGPAAGIVTEALKIMVKLTIKPTSTGFVGEFANFVVSLAMVLPASALYHRHKTKRRAMAGLALGTLSMTVVGILVNALVMIPFYSHLMPLDTIISLGAAINPAISNIWTFALIAVGPFNLIKGVLISFITALIYKRISRLIHDFDRTRSSRDS